MDYLGSTILLEEMLHKTQRKVDLETSKTEKYDKDSAEVSKSQKSS